MTKTADEIDRTATVREQLYCVAPAVAVEQTAAWKWRVAHGLDPKPMRVHMHLHGMDCNDACRNLDQL